MKDSGCQENFVTEKFAENNNLKVIKNSVNLGVLGFNGSKQYSWKVVELNISLGNETYNFLALTTSSIIINLSTPDLCEMIKPLQMLGTN